jgi:cation:H+ antiporter
VLQTLNNVKNLPTQVWIALAVVSGLLAVFAPMSVNMWLVIMAVITVIIAKACDVFEPAADHLGRDMPPGIKGAVINAIGSSMPELWTTVALLFWVGHADSFAAGISVTAGSAVFNGNIIPMVSVLAVMSPFMIRMLTLGIVSLSPAAKISEIEVDRMAILRDAAALIAAEGALILLLGQASLDWVDGLILVGLYVPYVLFMWWQANNHVAEEGDDDDDEDEDEVPMTTSRAWRNLGISTAVLVVACFVLGEGIIGSAHAMGVHPVITAMFLGAAASSVPDTILSVKDAMKGNYEDAVANAFGSNTFDICIALGAPLMVYTWMHGEIVMPENDSIQALRIGLIVVSVLTVATLLIPRKIRLWHAGAMGALYIAFSVFALNTEFHWFPMPF